MLFADTSQSLSTLGVPGLVAVVLVLAGVIVLLYKRGEALQNKIDSMYEQRIAEQKETRDKVMEPLEKQASMAEKTYELLLNLTNRGK